MAESLEETFELSEENVSLGIFPWEQEHKMSSETRIINVFFIFWDLLDKIQFIL